mgnify:CR=1 FL=1
MFIFSNNLKVQGFYSKEDGSMLPAEASGVIKTGDRLIAINDKTVESHKQLTDLIKMASLPLRLRLRPPSLASTPGDVSRPLLMKTIAFLKFFV